LVPSEYDGECFISSGTIADHQDALDPKAVSYKNRKSNSKLFHAIENGNFDDFDLSVGTYQTDPHIVLLTCRTIEEEEKQ